MIFRLNEFTIDQLNDFSIFIQWIGFEIYLLIKISHDLNPNSKGLRVLCARIDIQLAAYFHLKQNRQSSCYQSIIQIWCTEALVKAIIKQLSKINYSLSDQNKYESKTWSWNLWFDDNERSFFPKLTFPNYIAKSKKIMLFHTLFQSSKWSMISRDTT